MKRILITLLFTGMGLTALLFGVSCSNQAPNSAFIAPAQTVAFNNPAWTFTPTSTFTPTFTITPTPIPYPIGGFNAPYALAIDSKNNIYVGDTGNSLIKQYVGGYLNTNWPAGKTKSSCLPYTAPKAIAVDGSGDLYVVGGANNAVSKYDSNGNFIVQYSAASFTMSGPLGIAVQGTTIYVSDTGNSRILSITPAGVFNLYAGSVTYSPYGLAFDTFGNLYVAGSDSKIHQYLPGGSPGTIIRGFNSPYAVALDSNNDLFISDTGNKQIEEIEPGTNNYASSPSNFIGVGILSSPEGIALDNQGNVYVVDSGNSELFQFP